MLGILGVIKKMITSLDIRKIIKQKTDVNPTTIDNIVLWEDIYTGKYYKERNLKTMNMHKVIPEELARLATLEIDISIGESARANYLQDRINSFKDKIRVYMEYACALGGVMLKPNSQGDIDFVKPRDFVITEFDSNNGTPLGAIFFDRVKVDNIHYVRAEYHRFEDGLYVITNKAFISNSKGEMGASVPLTSVEEWAEIQEEVNIQGLEKPLFSYLKMPSSNNIDINSSIGMSCIANCIQQIDDLNIAYTRFADENEDSGKVVFVSQNAVNFAKNNGIKLPRYIQGLNLGIDESNTIQEHNPVLQTEVRKQGINFLLSIIGYQCGFSAGYFAFDEKTGLVTATQIEADQQRTVQTISDIRKSLKTATDDLIYALDKIADLYNLAPYGDYEVSYYFKDITASFEEDRQRIYKLVLDGIFPKWKYLVEYEGYSEEEAKQMIAEARSDTNEQNKSSGLLSGQNRSN